LIVNPEEVEGVLTGAGAPFSSFEQACAKQATQATEKLPVSVDKNSLRFIIGWCVYSSLKHESVEFVYNLPDKIYSCRLI
jgi:hypothetical protein